MRFVRGWGWVEGLGLSAVSYLRIAENISVEASWFDSIDAVFWGPVALLVSDKKGAVLIEAYPVGSTKTVRKNLCFPPIGTDF